MKTKEIKTATKPICSPVISETLVITHTAIKADKIADKIQVQPIIIDAVLLFSGFIFKSIQDYIEELLMFC